jgi:hypothetical protein
MATLPSKIPPTTARKSYPGEESQYSTCYRIRSAVKSCGPFGIAQKSITYAMAVVFSCPLPALTLAEPNLRVAFPVQKYKRMKMVPVPFDPRISNGARFASLREALMFVARHCQFHHRTFNRRLARMYLPFCRTLSLVCAAYVSCAGVSKKEFDDVFREVARLFESR